MEGCDQGMREECQEMRGVRLGRELRKTVSEGRYFSEDCDL